ncbi:unnamed protein product, partial [Brassica rapa subsp. trilocularis]
AGTSAPPRRGPIQIPSTDNSALIEMNKLTLIGRVTNPTTQNTRALVDFFLQHWQVTGSITGRDLGPRLFQFSFESERDLQSVLNRAPYHFKKWMILLQRWEPIVSDSFPSTIAFWIRIHGIPLHYWTKEALQAIGSELVENGVARSSHTTSQHIPLSQVSHTPSPRPLREPMRSQSAAGSGDIIASSERRLALERLAPATTQGSPKDRPSALERLSPAGSFNGSHDRRSALARLSLPSDRDPLPLYEDGGTNSGLPTCNETHYLNEPLLDVPFSKDTEVLDPLTSPIRSLSEDRRHVSLRLGPAPVEQNATDLPRCGTSG